MIHKKFSFFFFFKKKITQSNGSDDLTPRKRPRKQQFGDYQPSAKKFQSDVHIQPEQQPIAGSTLNEQGVTINYQNATSAQAAANLTNRNAVKTSNENSPPKIVDFYIKRPKSYNLLDVSGNHSIYVKKEMSLTVKNRIYLQSYKHSWKSTHNHFQRYSDVKPREERKPTVVDLANQTHVLQKVNGWKIYHLTSQMEDLVSNAHRYILNVHSVFRVFN